tara:strand:+ start:120 stop:317 length:198 start_codon:yes stop_codon:yes gene_type:complete
MISIEMDVRTAAAVRSALFTDTKVYTYDEKSCPQRVKDIRSVIQDIDVKIQSELEAEAPDHGVGK